MILFFSTWPGEITEEVYNDGRDPLCYLPSVFAFVENIFATEVQLVEASPAETALSVFASRLGAYGDLISSAITLLTELDDNPNITLLFLDDNPNLALS